MTDQRKRPSAVLVALIALCAALCVAPLASAQGASPLDGFFAARFPDNADLRAKLFSSIIGAPRELALAYGQKTLQSRSGPVTVRAVKRASDFIIEFVNGSGAAPTMGSCYIQRSNAKGYMVQAKILLEDDPSCYLRLYPQGSGTRGDVVMYGAVVKKGLYFEGMLYRIIILPFGDIVDLTKRAFDWSSVYKLDSEAASAGLLAELRQPEPAAPAAAPAGSSRTALASTPSVPAAGSVQSLAASKAASRGARLSTLAALASTPESLALDLAQAGEIGAREIDLPAGAAAAFGDERGDPGFASFGEFPRYEAGKGIILSAARAALFLDLSSNPESAYVLLGEGLRAVVVPAFDASGRLSFSFFSEGKETGWAELASDRLDLRVRAVRIPASRS